MRPSRTVVTAVAAWLVVVAVGSTVVWAVISRAGEGIAPSVGPGVAATSTAPSRPSGGSSGAATAPATGPERRTWQGPGGLVTVECAGSAISLVGSSADAGFVVETDPRPPDEVRVSFEGQDEEGRETEVRARCVDGVPDFAVDARDD